jgi:TonB-linked SusC/RagA family outer membrane protein
MKLTCILFFLSVSFAFATGSYAQKTVISMTVSDKTIAEVLETIENETEFHFYYNSKLINTSRLVSVRVKNKPVFAVLDQLFSGHDVYYKVVDKDIILTTSESAGTNGANQNKVAIGGAVTDTNNEPIIGANVVEKGTTNGTVTDVNGKFDLQVSPGATLVISFIGYNTQEIAAGNRTVIGIALTEDAQALEEVVVVGYGTQRKRDLTGAVSSVKMSDAPVGTFSTASHALAGKAAGLRVTQSTAQPGAGATFRIRGETSINAGNDPLIIVDGFPVSKSSAPGSAYYDAGSQDNVLEMINPNDIESIEVLKDASATAIYGSRAGHGVIIITTKRGKEGKLQVTYSGNVAVQKQSAQYEMLDAAEYMGINNRYFNELYRSRYGLGIYAPYATSVPAVIPSFEEYMAAGQKAAHIYTANEIAGAKTTDWMKEVTRTGIQHSHNLSLTGGNEKAKYLASLNYFDQQGILKNNDMDRLTVNLNSDYQLSRYVKAGVSLNISRNQYNNVPLGMTDNEGSGVIASALYFDPNLPVRDANGKFTKSETYNLTPNPVSLLEIADNTTKDRILGSSYLSVEPITGLTLKATVGFDRRAAKRKNYLPSTTLQGERRSGSASQNQQDGLDYLLDLTANYMKTIDKHSFTVLAGYEYQKFTNEGFNAGVTNFSIDGFLYNNLGAGTLNKSMGSYANMNSLASVFGRINYSFDGKYLLAATLRADGASNFNPAYRWGAFPSVSVGWRFTEESFMESIRDVLSNGKLRVGYGQTGNSNVGNRTQDYFGTSPNYAFGDNVGAGGIYVSELGNPAITWETTTEWNIGIDLGFLNNRINFSAEYYDRVISDILQTGIPLPGYNELTSFAGNFGSTQGQGVELTLNTVNIQRTDFVWTSDLTFYHYEDRWKKRAPTWVPDAYQKVTDPIRAMHYYKSNGLLQVGEAAPAWQTALLPGQVKLLNLSDKDQANTLSQYDKILIGDRDPDFAFGFNNTLRYKGFDFNMYLYGEVGRRRDVSYYDDMIPYRYSLYASGGRNGFKNLSKKALNSWTEENRNTSVPSILRSATDRGDYFLQKVSFLRCRNITLGYTLPAALKNPANSIRINLGVNNPFVISNWNGIDPETDYNPNQAANTVQSSYPNVRTYSVGIDINF